MAGKILLLGANERACFSVARNLSRHQYVVDVANWGPHEISRSRFVNEFHVLPKVEYDLESFYKAFIQLVSTRSYWLILPINDLAVEFLNRYKNEIEKFCIVGGINEPSTICYSRNKYELWRICRESSIHVPDSRLVQSLEEFKAVKSSLGYPLIAKPVSSRKIIGNRIYSFTVRKYSDEESLEDFVRERIQVIPIMLQEIVSGFGIGFNFLAHHGKLIAWYMHERINEPAGGGESSYRKTIIGDKYAIADKSRLLIEKIGWHGVGMIEYKVSDGKAYVMELNGRFWGSIELGIFAGMELPYWQVLYNYEQQPLPPVAMTCNREVYARNLRNDLLSSLKQKSLKKTFQWFTSIPKMLRSSECIEDSVFADFRFRISMWGTLISKFGRNRWDGLLRRFASISRNRPGVKQEYRKVVFICEGNICRSPFAEHYLRIIRPDINVASAGLQFQSSKMSPLNAIRAAGDSGIDLSLHSSSYVSDLKMEEFDALFVMDKLNFQKIAKGYPHLLSRVYFLDPQVPIPDPYGKSVEEFKICYNRIKQLVEEIFSK